MTMKKLFTCLLLLASSATMMALDIVVTTVADNASTEDVIDGSFRAAVRDAVGGDVIKFNPSDGSTIELKQKIGFSGADMKIVVDGLLPSGQPIIITKSEEAVAGTRMIGVADGNSVVCEGLDVTIKNISFKDIATNTNGSAIMAGNGIYNSTGANPDVKFDLTVENCQFLNCVSTFTPASSGGGGALFVSHGTRLVVKNCLFAYNKVIFETGPDTGKTFGGGAIGSTGSNTASMKLYNSTFYCNTSDGRGGGVYSGHHIDVINCTITGNIASGRGGGLHFNTGTSTTNVINTILAYNKGDGSYGDFSGNPTATANTLYYNIIGQTNLPQETIDELGPNNVLFTDGMPLFAEYTADESINKIPVLADNGGWYQTVALPTSSMAKGQGIAAVTGFDIPTSDQRGWTRATPPCIGAYEYGATAPSAIELQKAALGGIIAVGDQVLLPAGSKGTVNVYNLAGKVVYSAKVNGGGIISNLPQGAYIVKLVESTGLSVVSKVLLK
jgi:hypothetical protein